MRVKSILEASMEGFEPSITWLGSKLYAGEKKLTFEFGNF